MRTHVLKWIQGNTNKRKGALLATEKLFGQSMLMDGTSHVILKGEIALMSDGAGRSEIHVKNEDTGAMERLVFTTGPLWIPVMHLIQAIRDTHEEHDIGASVIDGTVGECTECDGIREAQDDEGNWRPCPVCGGIP